MPYVEYIALQKEVRRVSGLNDRYGRELVEASEREDSARSRVNNLVDNYSQLQRKWRDECRKNWTTNGLVRKKF